MYPDVRAGLLALVLLAAPATGWSLASDREQPIHIEADSVQIDDIRGVSVYRGHVVFTQGTMRLEADTVELYHDEHRKLSRLEARGAPARFAQRLDGDDEDMRAQALRMEYFAVPERLVLEQEAWIWRQDVEFTGDFISYDAEQDVVSARKDAGADGRVHIVIQPRQGVVLEVKPDAGSNRGAGPDPGPDPAPEQDAR